LVHRFSDQPLKRQFGEHSRKFIKQGFVIARCRGLRLCHRGYRDANVASSTSSLSASANEMKSRRFAMRVGVIPRRRAVVLAFQIPTPRKRLIEVSGIIGALRKSLGVGAFVFAMIVYSGIYRFVEAIS
jgi:hypothetical protein